MMKEEKGEKRRNGRERNRRYEELRVDRSITRLDDSLAAVIVVIGTRHSSRAVAVSISSRNRGKCKIKEDSARYVERLTMQR